jgi:hypothetical protein
MQGRKKTTKKSTQNVVDGRTLGHQSKRRSTRNARKPHRCVVEEEGSLTSTASSERDTSNSSDYNSEAGELEGSELPVASSVMKEQKKAASKRTPTPNVMYPSPPFSDIVFEVHFDVKDTKSNNINEGTISVKFVTGPTSLASPYRVEVYSSK